MRNRKLAMVWLLASAAVAATAAAGCYDTLSDSAFFLQQHGSVGGSGGSGGTGGAPPGCIPNQTGDAIEDSCGIFVSALDGEDSNDGKTTDTAVATIGHAITLAQGKRIYACADEAKPYEQAIELDGDATIFGGLDCTTWKYVAGTKTRWTAAADELPLRLADGASVAIADMAIEAADATKDGGSSIAILAQAGASVELARCEVTAGNGKDGATPEAPVGSGMVGAVGVDGKTGCVSVDDLTGGKGGALTCSGDDVGGGQGGTGNTTTTGGDGSKGNPNDIATGLGGSGQKETPATACTPGGDGAEGVVGDPGLSATGKGSLSSTGYTGESGKEGASIGQPGHGGGGGGGAKKCGVNAGPSAGGGGSGGCGGAKGKGGQAGGASIAIVSLGATLALADVKVTAKKGGKGGDGGLGQPGGDGGLGGMPGSNGGDMSAVACAGGKGGKGGPGGRGGGGLGGHSIGIAYTGTAPDVAPESITISSAGNGGAGEAGTGDPGTAEKLQDF